MLLYTLFMVVCGLSAVTAQRVLALPDPKSCAKRKYLPSITLDLLELHYIFLMITA